MKHVFVVHSNITYLAALGVIVKEKLNMEDIVILSSYFGKETPVKCHYININHRLKEVLIHPKKVLFPVKYADNEIARLCNGERFIAYVDCMLTLHRIAATHPLCDSINFIEEGSGVYTHKHSLLLHSAGVPRYGRKGYRNHSLESLLYDVMIVLKGYSLKMMSLPFYYDAYVGTDNIKFYGFSKDSFYAASHKEIISLKSIRDAFHWTTTLDIDDCNIWLGQSYYVESYTLESYINGIKEGCAKKLKEKNVDAVWIKFHPVEKEDSKELTKKVFKEQGIETKIISDEVILEIELLKASNVVLWGNNTSIFLYASQMGITCNSIAEFIEHY